MDTIIVEKFLYNKIWRTGRICSHCGLWEHSKDTYPEFENWIREPKCRAGDGDGHLWRHPYPHEVEAREEFSTEFLKGIL